MPTQIFSGTEAGASKGEVEGSYPRVCAWSGRTDGDAYTHIGMEWQLHDLIVHDVHRKTLRLSVCRTGTSFQATILDPRSFRLLGCHVA